MTRLLFVLPLLFFAACAQPEAPAPVEETAVSVDFVTPVDGDTLSTTFPVQMAVEGVSLAIAGTMQEGTGHLHILINEDFVDAGVVIPNNETHRHYGDASSATELTLEPGEYTLRLQFANGAHIALDGDQYRDEIQVVVQE